MRPSAALLALACLSASVALSPAGLACGYHNSVDLARGMLNWAYPDSLHVKSAVWAAQLQGRLSRDDRPVAAKALLGYGQVVKELSLLRDVLDVVRKPDDPAVAVVLLGPVLWARLEPRTNSLEMTPHVPGPAPGDVVAVTEEDVIKGLVEGQVSPQEALDLGLIRLYGAAEAVHRLTAWIIRAHPPIANGVAKLRD